MLEAKDFGIALSIVIWATSIFAPFNKVYKVDNS
jgi:hypothetical protein